MQRPTIGRLGCPLTRFKLVPGVLGEKTPNAAVQAPTSNLPLLPNSREAKNFEFDKQWSNLNCFDGVEYGLRPPMGHTSMPVKQWIALMERGGKRYLNLSRSSLLSFRQSHGAT